jgi:hypothetical protein
MLLAVRCAPLAAGLMATLPLINNAATAQKSHSDSNSKGADLVMEMLTVHKAKAQKSPLCVWQGSGVEQLQAPHVAVVDEQPQLWHRT